MRLPMPVQIALGVLLLVAVHVVDYNIWPYTRVTALILFVIFQMVRSWRRGDRQVVWLSLLAALVILLLFVGAYYLEASRGG